MSLHATEIGRQGGAAPGPTLLLVGGIHGNEPAGVRACERLFERLRTAPLRSGEVVAFVGNPAALALGRRHVERDLNRQWTPERLAAAHALGDRAEAEDRALVALADAIEATLARARGPVFALDLHTSSSDGGPFLFVTGDAPAREFAARLPLCGIAGAHPLLPGVMATWLTTRGCVALAVEGGPHAGDVGPANLEAVLTLALAASGLVPEAEVVGLAEARATLERARGDLPLLIEVEHRHHVDPAGGFTMVPGFLNISRTPAGTLLAHEHGRELRAPFDGYVLLPLYQPQGEDGYFYGRAAE